MPRFFLPRHGRTHLPGGSDPIPELVGGAGSDIPWAIIAATSGQTIPANTTLTFALSSHNFHTNDPATFSIRSGSPPFQGIEFLRTGIYECDWYLSASLNTATTPELDWLRLTAGLNGNDVYAMEIDLSNNERPGWTTPGGSTQGKWRLAARWLIGIETLTGAPSLTAGVTNFSSTVITNGGEPRMFAKRLSDPIDDFSDFF